MSATQSDDWYEESSPNLAATLDPNDHDLEDSTNHSDGSDETNVLFTNCSLPTPFFRWENTNVKLYLNYLLTHELLAQNLFFYFMKTGCHMFERVPILFKLKPIFFYFILHTFEQYLITYYGHNWNKSYLRSWAGNSSLYFVGEFQM